MTVSPAALHRLGGAGAPVLLVHGFAADRFGWAANAHALMAGRTVWAAELPGHGASGNEVGQGTAADLAQGLAAGIADLPEGVPVVAHSLGAAAVLHLAARHPGRFGPMVLIAPAGLGAGIDAGFARDLAALRAFLAARIETSMFLLGNLEAEACNHTGHSGMGPRLGARPFALADLPDGLFGHFLFGFIQGAVDVCTFSFSIVVCSEVSVVIVSSIFVTVLALNETLISRITSKHN